MTISRQRQRDEAVRSADLRHARRSSMRPARCGLGSTPMIGFDAEAVHREFGLRRRRNPGDAADRRAGAGRQLAAEAAHAGGRRPVLRIIANSIKNLLETTDGQNRCSEAGTGAG